MCRANKVSHVESKKKKTPWTLTPWPRFNNVLLKSFESDWTITLVYGTLMSLVSTESKLAKAQSPTFWPRPNLKGHVISTDDGWATLWRITVHIWLLWNHPTLRCKREEITDKRIDKRTKDGRTIQLPIVNALANLSGRRIKTSLFRANKVSQTKYHSWPWPLMPWPKINVVPVLIIENMCMNFQSDRT